MLLSEIIHCSKEKFMGDADAYHNFKRLILQAQKAISQADLYLSDCERQEWGISIEDLKKQIARFEFED